MVATLFGFFGFGALVTWACREHELAEKYRHDARYTVHPSVSFAIASSPNLVAASTTPSWTVTFKVGRGTRSVVIEGATEEEAILKAVKTNSVGYDAIVSSVKN